MELTGAIGKAVSLLEEELSRRALLEDAQAQVNELEAKGITRIFDPVILTWHNCKHYGQHQVSLDCDDYKLIADLLPDGMKTIAQESTHRFIYDSKHLKSITSALVEKKVAWKIDYVKRESIPARKQ
jgi:hypothetical protein